MRLFIFHLKISLTFRLFDNLGVYIESFIMDLDVDGVYRVFPFMKTILPIDKPSVMSLSPTLAHLIALQV